MKIAIFPRSAFVRIALFSILAIECPTKATSAPQIPLPNWTTRSQEPSFEESRAESSDRSDWIGILSAHETWRHRFQRDEDGLFTARNPGQRWDTVFDGRGFRVRPDHEKWEWGLELRSYGIGDEQIALSVEPESVTKSAAGSDDVTARLAYRRDALLEEWFRNDARGLEQGWTLAERPADVPGLAGEKLHLDLAVRGGLRPEVAGSGRAVQFVDDTGATALTYGGLKAWDAGGRALDARFVPADSDPGAAALRIEVDERGAVYPVTIDPVAQQTFLKPFNTGAGDEFGRSVAIDGDTVVVGAYEEDGNLTDSGAAYVFVRDGASWTQQAYLKASNAGAGDRFGISVSVSGDTIVVGAHGEDSAATGVNGDQNDDSALSAGAAYVFVRNGASWTQQAYLKASNSDANDEFGSGVSVTGDMVVVGASSEDSDATAVDGDQNDDTSVNAGAAYVFVRSGGIWVQQAYLKASNTGAGDNFGAGVAASGDTVVVGALREDSDATGVDGDQNNNSASGSGAAYIFSRNGGIWIQQAYLKASNAGTGDLFGASVAVSGDTVVVGAPLEASDATGVDGPDNDNASGSGAAYVFARSGGIWVQQAYLKASNTGADDAFGISVAVSGGTAVVGAQWEDSDATGIDGTDNDNSADSGAAYVFTRSSGSWSQQAYLKASNTGANDEFAKTGAVSGSLVVVGASGEDSAAAGVGGNENDNSASLAGAAYTFRLSVADPPVLDTTPPSLRFLKKRKLKSPRPRHKIKGLVTDDATVARVEVKSRLHRGWKKAKLKSSGQWIYRTPRLDPGRNAFKIRAVDSTGNLSRTQRIKATGR